MEAKLVSLYRHLVKGLNPESLQSTKVETGGTLEGDRAFAFQFLDPSIPEELQKAAAATAPWMPKFYLAVQHDWPDLARIVPTWNAKDKSLKLSIENPKSDSLEAPVNTEAGRERLSDFLSDYLKDKKPFAKARHPMLTRLRLIGDIEKGTRYTDGEKGPVSLALQETMGDLEMKFGFPIDERRFRLNIFLKGAPAWSELGWIGKKLRIGKCILQITKPIGRCPNIDVDQDSGERKDEIFSQLKSTYGHSLTGIKAEVLEGSLLKLGDDWELLNI